MTDDELNAEVARRVFGEAVRKTDSEWQVKGSRYVPWYTPPKYATRIEDAWCVVEKMRELGYWFHLDSDVSYHGETLWMANFTAKELIRAETAPKAIVLAALSALTPPAEKGGKER